MTSQLLGVLLATSLLAAPSLAAPQDASVGMFEGQTDVGGPKKAGSTSFDAKREEYTISGAGANMWAGRDEFRYVWKRMKGNFILTTRARFLGKGVDPHRKVGWTVRPSLDANAPHATAVVHGDGLTSLQYRRTPGADTEEAKSKVTGADVIQLERKGDMFTMSVARFGDPFASEQITGLALGDEVYVGLFVCSHNPEIVEQGVFRDVRITVPVKEGFVPYRDYIGSRLETLEVATGNRSMLYYSPDSLQAPNWTVDGKALIYNSKGRLFRYDLAKGTPAAIDTGFATNNNNDHVLSFDGKMIAISHHSAEDGNNSIVYTLPTKGGTPKRITAKGPSYLHGWSPDGKYVIYTGGRDDEYDIYRMSTTGTGDEVQLTTSKGLDDGPEYSPDGKYIYFNSTRSGTMQIWRMKADGSEQTQVTNDEFNNWFPHLSPDGKWMTILSFLKDVSPDDHPFYKHVYIRLMPVGGGTPKVIAYLYGGQGTINVPSWSPDGKRVAFVSNTDQK